MGLDIGLAPFCMVFFFIVIQGPIFSLTLRHFLSGACVWALIMGLGSNHIVLVSSGLADIK